MTRKRKLSNARGRCRICLVDHGCMSNLFEEDLETKIKDLTKCTSIDIKTEHDLPNVICHVCLYKLDLWSEFKEQFVRSNKILLNQLELSGASDDQRSHSKRIHIDLQQGNMNSLSDTPDKKVEKIKVPPLISIDLESMDGMQVKTISKEIYVSGDEPASSKDSSQKAYDVSNSEEYKNDKAGQNESKMSLSPTKMKSLTGKRGRTTERRKASTKRWVARKKALLAATGENASDTDSIVSDDTQLSPVQKARAKTNAEKEAEKRLAKDLQNLETTVTSKYGSKDHSDYICVDTDSDIPKAKCCKNVKPDNRHMNIECDVTKNSTEQNEIKKGTSLPEDIPQHNESSQATLPENSVTQDLTEIQAVTAETFTPCSVKSELEVGDTTYIVTSTLILAEPHYLNKANLRNLSKDLKSGSIEQNSREKNTDIIDAVQLRRINPIPADLSDKKCIQRCLNIEVEGTEIEPLKRVQLELAGFVEKEMKHRLFGTKGSDTKKENSESVRSNSYQTLDQQLKNIVEKTIKNNLKSSMMRSCGVGYKLPNRNSRTVSGAFIKWAMTSERYQPKVELKRLDIAKESMHRKINNLHILSKKTVKNRLGGPFSMVARKRQSVLPKKYNDYNTSALDSDSNLSNGVEISEVRKDDENTRVQKPSIITGDQMFNSMTQNVESTSEVVVPTSTTTPATIVQSSVASERIIESQENVNKTESLPAEKHICGVCGQSFISRDKVAAHVQMHKNDNTMPRQNKNKMMRCKRCHEIVEARFVKAHVCKSTKQVHKCYVCNSTFRTEKLLVRHLQSHDQSEFNIENITKGEPKKAAKINLPLITKSMVLIKVDRDQHENAETTAVIKPDNVRTTVRNGQSEQVKSTNKLTKLDSTRSMERSKETYTCFVCDKIFTDEEELKDHLQKHCDDISEGEQSIGKEQYQCAICGDSMESESALEAHVERHLFDEEDDNPNLISIANDNEKSKDNSYDCLQCTEKFNCEMLLEMHMQAHEEEAAIAEWEKQGIKPNEFQCMICDEPFETEDELSEHLDVHNGNAHVCQLCEKPFPSLEDLQSHVATH